MASEYIFTSEAVTEGHPDKLCDQISDALVDQHLLQDPQAQVVAECAVSTGILFVSVKAESSAVVDIPHTARQVILDVGYDRGLFNGKNCTIMTNISDRENGAVHVPQAADPEAEAEQLLARDNVTLFGYACNQTPAQVPLPIHLAHALVQQMDGARKERLHYLAPDGKCQVGVRFRDHTPVRVESITLSASQRAKAPDPAQLRADLLTHVVEPVLAQQQIALPDGIHVTINPEGLTIEGGPALHAGLTGRKNGDDTYGSFSRQGSAALSGKDPARVDRVGAYAARHAAKNVVAAGLAERCEVQLSYSIGVAGPVSVRVETFGTGHMPDDLLTQRVMDRFDFRVGAIIHRFQLRDLPRRHDGRFYRRLAVYGHVGRLDLPLPWESTARADLLRVDG